MLRSVPRASFAQHLIRRDDIQFFSRFEVVHDRVKLRVKRQQTIELGCLIKGKIIGSDGVFRFLHVFFLWKNGMFIYKKGSFQSAGTIVKRKVNID